jgi:molybdate transport system substrate-binding protein
MTQTVRVLAAGSLRRAFAALEPAFAAAAPDIRLIRRHGPAGLLRAEIERGADFDVFCSADMGHPERLVATGRAVDVRCFARNGFVATVREGLAVDTATLVEVLSDPTVRLATSTPGADPSGDYAEAFFDAVEAAKPGQGAALRAKALRLVGGPGSLIVPEGRSGAAWLIGEGKADAMLGYASHSAGALAEGGVRIVALPADLAPVPAYGVCRAAGADPAAARFVDYLTGDAGQEILARHGFRAS